MYLACTAESMLLALVCPENWSASAYMSAVTSGRGKEWPQYCHVRTQRVLGKGLEFYSTSRAYFKGPCFGLITVCLQGFRNCAKHTVAIIFTTCSTIEKKIYFSCRILLFLLILKVSSQYLRIQHQPVVLCTGSKLRLLWGTNWNFKYYLTLPGRTVA